MNGSPQLDYGINLTPGLEGQIADDRTAVCESAAARGIVPFGRAVTSDSANGVQVPKRNVGTVIFSADLVTSNVINGKVNGVAIDAVTFASSHAATMASLGAAVVAALATLEIDASYTVGGSNDRTLTVTAANTSLLFAEWVVTAGSSQATVTHTYTTSYVFRGVSTWIQKQRLEDGSSGYGDTETVGYLRRGLIWVKAKGAVTKDSAIYAVLATSGYEGQFTVTSTGNIATSGVARSDAADGALFLLELNMP